MNYPESSHPNPRTRHLANSVTFSRPRRFRSSHARHARSKLECCQRGSICTAAEQVWSLGAVGPTPSRSERIEHEIFSESSKIPGQSLHLQLSSFFFLCSVIFGVFFSVWFWRQGAAWCSGIAMISPQQTPRVSAEPRKKPSYFPLYWLVYRDPYDSLL